MEKGLAEIFSNNICFDCFDENVEFCSINNSVFLCRKCAEEHAKLGKNASFLVKISTKLDQFLSVYIERGGNDRLYKFLEQFKLNNTPILTKYRTFACEWYRRLLYSEVNCEEPPQKLNPEEYCKLCSEPSDYLEWNFDGYAFEENKFEYLDQSGIIQNSYASAICESNNYSNSRKNEQDKQDPKKRYELDLNLVQEDQLNQQNVMDNKIPNNLAGNIYIQNNK